MTRTHIGGCLVAGLAIVSGVLYLMPSAAALADSSNMQPQSRLNIIDLGEPAILAAPYDPHADAVFAEVMGTPNGQRIAPYAAVVTNGSSLEIKGILIRWTTIDATGAHHVNNLQMDSYFNSANAAIIPARTRALVTPTGYLREDQVTAQITSVVPQGAAVDALDRAAEVSMSIDSVIFDNGRIIGPDIFGIGEFIETRHAAVRNLVSQVAAAKGGKAGVDAVLTALARPAGGDMHTNRSAYWTTKFASMLQRSPQLLAHLSRLPEPPAFVR